MAKGPAAFKVIIIHNRKQFLPFIVVFLLLLFSFVTMAIALAMAVAFALYS